MNEDIEELRKQLKAARTVTQKVNLLNELSYKMINLSIDESIELSGQAIELAEKAESGVYEPGLLNARKNLSIAYSLCGKYTESLMIIQELLPIIQSKKEYADIYLNLLHGYGHTLFRTANFPEALEQLFKALRTAETLKDLKAQSRACDAIASVYGMIEDFDHALVYFNKALEYAPDSPSYHGFIKNNTAMMFNQSGNFQKALEYGKESLDIADKEKIERLLPNVLDTLGEAYMNLGLHDQALIHLNRALDSARKNKIEDAEFFILLNLGRTYTKLKNIKALECYKKALRLSDKLGVKSDVYKCRLGMSEYYEQTGNFKKALEHYKLYHALEKEVFNSQSDLRIKTLNIIHETDKAAKETELLRRHLKDKDLLIAETHHRIKNNLAMVTSMINLKASVMPEETDLSDLQNQVSAIVLIHDKLFNNEEFTQVKFKNYAQEVINAIIRSIPALKVELMIDIDDTSIPSSAATTIGLIINELVTNAVKHAFDPEKKNTLSIRFKEEDRYVLTQTNSIGKEQAVINFGNPNSLGLRLIKALAGQLNGELATHAGKNFSVEIMFPK
ncbi:MAG: tetratricopeptide repeat protein [Spirochaetia bacterium]